MKKLLVLVLTVVMAGSAFAVVDDTDNNLGIYFDMTGDTVCTTAAPYATVNAYLTLTNPTFTALLGHECGITLEGTAIVLGATFTNPQALNVGTPLNQIVGYGTPTMVTEATVVSTLQILNTDATGGAIWFSLGASDPSSNDMGLPTVLADDYGNAMTTGYSTIDGMHCATINGACDVVATEPVTFDSVKSLYR